MAAKKPTKKQPSRSNKQVPDKALDKVAGGFSIGSVFSTIGGDLKHMGEDTLDMVKKPAEDVYRLVRDDAEDSWGGVIDAGKDVLKGNIGGAVNKLTNIPDKVVKDTVNHAVDATTDFAKSGIGSLQYAAESMIDTTGLGITYTAITGHQFPLSKLVGSMGKGMRSGITAVAGLSTDAMDWSIDDSPMGALGQVGKSFDDATHGKWKQAFEVPLSTNAKDFDKVKKDIENPATIAGLVQVGALLVAPFTGGASEGLAASADAAVDAGAGALADAGATETASAALPSVGGDESTAAAVSKAVDGDLLSTPVGPGEDPLAGGEETAPSWFNKQAASPLSSSADLSSKAESAANQLSGLSDEIDQMSEEAPKTEAETPKTKDSIFKRVKSYRKTFTPFKALSSEDWGALSPEEKAAQFNKMSFNDQVSNFSNLSEDDQLSTLNKMDPRGRNAFIRNLDDESYGKLKTKFGDQIPNKPTNWLGKKLTGLGDKYNSFSYTKRMMISTGAMQVAGQVATAAQSSRKAAAATKAADAKAAQTPIPNAAPFLNEVSGILNDPSFQQAASSLQLPNGQSLGAAMSNLASMVQSTSQSPNQLNVTQLVQQMVQIGQALQASQNPNAQQILQLLAGSVQELVGMLPQSN